MFKDFIPQNSFFYLILNVIKVGIFLFFILHQGFVEIPFIPSAFADSRGIFKKQVVSSDEKDFNRDFFENVFEELNKRKSKMFGTSLFLKIDTLLHDLKEAADKYYLSMESFFRNEEKKAVADALGEICVDAIKKVHSINFTNNDLKNIQKEINKFNNASENYPPIKRVKHIENLINEVKLGNQKAFASNSPSGTKAPQEGTSESEKALRSILKEVVENLGYETLEFKFYREKMIEAGISSSIYENKDLLKAAKVSLKNKKKAYEDIIESLKNKNTLNSDDQDQHFNNYEKLMAYEAQLKNINDAVDEVKLALKVLRSKSLESSDQSQFKKISQVISTPAETSMLFGIHNEHVSHNQCNLIQFDHRAHMGEDSNQRETGTCWAHAAAALFEEQLCLAQPQYCGKRIARTQIVGMVDGDIFTREGRSAESLLKYFTDERGGNFQVCLDPYRRNPFDVREGPSQWYAFLTNQEKENNLNFNYVKYLKSEYRRIQSRKGKSPFCIFHPKPVAFDSLSKDWQKLVAFLDDSMEIKNLASHSKSKKREKSGLEKFTFWRSPKNKSQKEEFQFENIVPASSSASNSSVLNNYLSPHEFEALARSSSTEKEFIRKVLIAPCHQPNRKVSIKRGQNQNVITLIPTSHSASEKIGAYLKAFSDAKQYNTSVHLSLCANRLIDSKKYLIDTFYSRTCGSHAVVANAVTWNNEKKSCQVYVKNSWGQGSFLSSGWYPIETILKNTKEVNYFGSLK